MSKKITDRRAMKTRKAIKLALQQLMKKKALKNISVKEIAELADINRATFYAHYEDIYDLFHDFEADQFQALAAIFQDESLLTYSDFYNALLDYVNKHRELIKLTFLNTEDIPASPLRQDLERQLIQLAIESYKAYYKLEEMTPEMEYYCYYLVYGQIAMVEHWVRTDFALPLEKLKKMMSDIDACVNAFIVQQ